MLASLLMPRMPDREGGTCGSVVSAFRAAQPALPVAGACEQDGGFDGTRVEARTPSRGSHWQDAFADANDALALIPSLARAHAARGQAASTYTVLEQLNCSTESAEDPAPARHRCRQRCVFI